MVEMNERKKGILKAVINEYILTAEPIGSRTISKKYKLDVSSATIRNEMADLEDLGYLQQPHTSAGRIPSDKGYRFYVDSLIDVERIPESFEEMIRKKYLERKKEVQNIVQVTSQMLSQLTRYTALVASPSSTDYYFQHLQLVPLEGKKITIIVVISSGLVQHQTLTLQHRPSREELGNISRLINDRLQGLPLGKISSEVLGQLERELKDHSIFRELYRSLLTVLTEEGLSQEWGKIHLDGATNILEQPEFSDLEKVKVFLKLFEQEDILRQLLNRIPAEGLQVVIGGEIPLQEMKDCSLVVADYSIQDTSVGKMAILGPTRMNYPKVIAAVNFMAEVISKVMREED